MPIKGARMPCSAVAKCITTNYYAIIYDHDHSKHINDRLRCRQDNGATCLNCKVDFSLEMLNVASSASLVRLPPPPLLLKCKQSVSVTQLLHPVRIHITWAHSRSFHLSLPFFHSLCVFFPRALVWSKTALWHCERHPGSRKHQTAKEQLAKKTCKCVCVCVRLCAWVINKWIN